MKRILNYPGSKWGSAEFIIDLMPTHKSYLELFAGSLAVFFNKPKDVLETVNDIDGRLVNLFRVRLSGLLLLLLSLHVHA